MGGFEGAWQPTRGVESHVQPSKRKLRKKPRREEGSGLRMNLVQAQTWGLAQRREEARVEANEEIREKTYLELGGKGEDKHSSRERPNVFVTKIAAVLTSAVFRQDEVLTGVLHIGRFCCTCQISNTILGD